MADYLLTNEVYRPPLAQQGLHAHPAWEARQALWGVQPSYLEAALQVLEQEFGGAELFLWRQLALGARERALLIERYLQPA